MVMRGDVIGLAYIGYQTSRTSAKVPRGDTTGHMSPREANTAYSTGWLVLVKHRHEKVGAGQGLVHPDSRVFFSTALVWPKVYARLAMNRGHPSS